MRRHTRPTGAVRIRHRIIAKSVFNTRILCPDSSLYLVLFYYCIPDRFLRPFKNDGRYLIPFRKKNSFTFLLTLAPFIGFADTFPVFGDGLRSLYFAF